MDAGGHRAHAEAMNAADENQTSASAPPRLTRSTDDKVVSGVCGGLGRHFGVDPVVFRIAFVVMALAGGSGVLLYLVAWLLVPDDHSGATVIDRARHGHGSQVLAAVLLAVGAIVVLDRLGDNGGGGRFGGLVLLGVGAAVLWSRRGQPEPPIPPQGGTGSVPPPPPLGPPSPQPLSPPATGATAPAAPSPPPPAPAPDRTVEIPPSEVATDEMAGGASTLAATDPDGSTTAVVSPALTSSAPTLPEATHGQPPAPSPAWRAPKADKERRPPSVLVAVTLSLLAILAGVLVLVGGTDTVDVSLGTGLALALLVVGGALLVGAWRGRARWLVPLGVVLGVAVLATSVADVSLRGGVGDRAYRPRTVGELRSPYRLAAGDLVVDLSRLDLSATTESVTATMGAGDLEVVVPDGAEVVVDAHVGAGSMTVFGRQFEGTGNDRQVVETGREGGGRLILSARTGFGDLEVRHASS